MIKNNYYGSEEIKRNNRINDDGEFILEYDEFKKYFTNIYISKVENNYSCFIDTIYQNYFNDDINDMSLNMSKTILNIANNQSKLNYFEFIFLSF